MIEKDANHEFFYRIFTASGGSCISFISQYQESIYYIREKHRNLIKKLNEKCRI